MRINRALALTGICSRRAADRLIEQGLVMVNGKQITDFNFSVDLENDRIHVSGKPLSTRQSLYIALYKPKGVITTVKDERGRKSVLDLLPEDLRHLKPVGRLDRDSEGLLILTNDGAFAHQLMHPSKHVWKTYKVKVTGLLSADAIAGLERGVRLSEGISLAARVSNINCTTESSSFNISIRQGRNRQVRRMCAHLGYPVIRLVRVAIGRLQLKPMGPGEWKHLTKTDLENLIGPDR